MKKEKSTRKKLLLKKTIVTHLSRQDMTKLYGGDSRNETADHTTYCTLSVPTFRPTEYVGNSLVI
ncbi:class I lanthipeptide [Chitinophaga solisilvae]|uniref:class I lanthipeptide n=1 Tax=Chitinophaga solisilvae TaxID=1233460 RepID=UPI001923C4CB